jgi:hypothetical protein
MLPNKLAHRSLGRLFADNTCAICIAARSQPLKTIRYKSNTTKPKPRTGHWSQAPTSREKWQRTHRDPTGKQPEEVNAPQLDTGSANKTENVKTSQPINADVLAGAHRAGFLKISGDKAQNFMEEFWNMGTHPDEKQLRDACTCKI